jgi:hypothetical protein
MLQKIKAWLKRKLFSQEQLEYEARLLALKSMRTNASIVALAREQLSGFDPSTITLDSVRPKNRVGITIFDGMSEAERDEFIIAVHGLHSSKALRTITDFLTRAQVMEGAMGADSLTALNFSRATVNGLMLPWDTINEIEGIYLNLKKSPDSYDRFSVT